MNSVRDTWGRYAPRFAAEQADQTKRASIRKLLELTALPVGTFVLDVATGAGFTGFAFAESGVRVVHSDPTHEMLLATASSAPGAPLVEAWAEALPFRDEAFGAVVSHRAPHQFADRPSFLREARRIVRPGGIVAIGDQSPPDGFEDWHNDLERLRDPTHERALSPREWRTLVEEAGLVWERQAIVFQEHDVQDWLDRVDCSSDRAREVVRRLEAVPELIREAYRPELLDGRLTMRTPQCVFVARR